MIRDKNRVTPWNAQDPTKKPDRWKITLKDCLALMIGTAIPVAIGIYTAVTNEQMQKSAERAEDQQQSIAAERRAFDLERAAALYQQQLYQKFLDAMYRLHRDGELNDSADPWAFANARYRSVHREFDVIRKAQALVFLKEKELIGRQQCTTGCESKLVKDIIRLNGLNFDNLSLSSENDNLNQLDLSCVEFDQVSMRNVVFSYANLNGAIFRNSRLNDAKFQSSSLNCAKIIKTQLHGANFYDSNLNGTLFDDVDLSTVTLTQEQEQKARFENVIMSNGIKITSATMRTSITAQNTITTKATTTTTTSKATTTTSKATTTSKVTTPSKITTTSKVITETTTTNTTRGWLNTGSMNYARYGHTASVLLDGKVLVTGGTNGSKRLNSVELYDPSTNIWSWTSTNNLNEARDEHTASLLSNGKVLVTGGADNNGRSLNSAELYDPSTNTWTTTGKLNNARYRHTASVLSNGKVLVTGGLGDSGDLNNAELFDPSTNSWTTTGKLNNARHERTASLLSNGKVLVAGGSINSGASTNDLLRTAELYDPSTNSWTTATQLLVGRYQHTASLLSNGKVLVAGGQSYSGTLTNGELYDPSTNSWAFTITYNLHDARRQHTASVLLDGKVLVTGGADKNGRSLNSTELYNSSENSWTTASNLNNARYQHTASILPDGRVLVTGGQNGSIALNSAELY